MCTAAKRFFCSASHAAAVLPIIRALLAFNLLLFVLCPLSFSVPVRIFFPWLSGVANSGSLV